jgi:L-2-hydroxyglutarate oxidase LhgO
VKAINDKNKANKLAIIQDLSLALKKMTRNFNYLGLFFIGIAVTSTFLAMKFTQMGGFISLNGIVYQLINDKAKESSKSLAKDLKKSEKALSQEFCKDLNQFKINQQRLFQAFQEPSTNSTEREGLNKILGTFLEKKIDKFNKSFESSFSSIFEEEIKKVINVLNLLRIDDTQISNRQEETIKIREEMYQSGQTVQIFSHFSHI